MHAPAAAALPARLSSGTFDAEAVGGGASFKAPPTPTPRAAWWRGATAGAAGATLLLVALATAASTAGSRAQAPPGAYSHPSHTREGPGWLPRDSWPQGGGGGGGGGGHLLSPTSRLLVSYAYYEKDAGQASNLAFFAAVGMGAPPWTPGAPTPLRGAASVLPPPPHTDFVVTVAGDACTPCAAFAGRLAVDGRGAGVAGVSRAWSGEGYGPPRDRGTLALLHRTSNTGMDLASHNVSLTYAAVALAGGGKQPTGAAVVAALARTYAWFLFLNSSCKGPFLPPSLPPSYPWPAAYLHRFAGRVHLVASALVCLPPADAGGPGPRAESWAFALDGVGLATAVSASAFHAARTCKLCADGDAGIVVGGEYGLSKALLAHGYALSVLSSRYDPRVDWAAPTHWACNDGAHASRMGTHGGVSMHPFESVFVKASWGVGEPFTSVYARWALDHAAGKPGTAGVYNETAYRWAISEEAVRVSGA